MPTPTRTAADLSGVTATMAASTPVYVILGATGGVGSALARRLARDGARLLLAGRSTETLSAFAREVDAETSIVDATSIDDVEAAVSAARDRFGVVDGIANCVGSLLLKPAHAISAEAWGATITTNLTSAFATVRAAARVMGELGGSVVLVSSAAARLGLANHEAIAAAKAGIEGLALAAAATYAPRRIRVNCVAPGMTRTPLTAALWKNEVVGRASAEMHALGRIGEPDEVASAIAWLLHPEQQWVTGQVLGVDGGLSRVRSRAR